MTHTTAALRTTPQFIILWAGLRYLVIAVIALIPRVLDLGQFVTADEVNFWMTRSETFLRAIQTGDLAATAIAPHPGVTTMWLGSVGILLQQGLEFLGVLDDPSFATRLTLMQLPVALTHAAGVLIGYRMLRRLLPEWPAFLAALFWASDPFVIGYSRVLHVDALAATFLTLSVLAACLYWHHSQWPYVLVSGMCGALAVLSKSPALIILPVVMLIAFASASNSLSYTQRLWSILHPLLWWGLIFAITMLVGWPALFASPMEVLDLLRVGVEVEGANPHPLGNFFLGQPDDAPGALFYPLALVLRLTPWTLIGLLLVPFALRHLPKQNRRDVIALACLIILFIVCLSFFPKKFNRYIIPIFPSADIIAAVGIASLGSLRWGIGRWLRQAQNYILGVFVLLVTANVAYWHPYELVAYNQLLGGAQTGSFAFRSGWGEGYEQVADWLNQQPNITGVATATPRTEMIAPYLRPEAHVKSLYGETIPDDVGYVVVYLRDVHGGLGTPFDQFYGQVEPIHTIYIHGVAYAWIYQVAQPVAQPLPADFGDAIHLRGFEIVADIERGANMLINFFWETQSPLPTQYHLFVHLIGPDGQRYAQTDPLYPSSPLEINLYHAFHIPLYVPIDIPSGTYRVLIGIYDPANGERLPLNTSERVPNEYHELEVTTVQIE